VLYENSQFPYHSPLLLAFSSLLLLIAERTDMNLYGISEIHIGAEAMGEGLGKQAKVLTDTQVRRVLVEVSEPATPSATA
jgi:hypothetical protein